MNDARRDLLETQELQGIASRVFLATVIGSVSYGTHVSVALSSIYLILVTKKQGPYFKFHIAYISLLFILGTANIAFWAALMADGTKALFLQETDPYLNQLPPKLITYGAIYTGASAIITVLSIGLLLYRCYIIYGMRIYVVILPALLYVATVVLGTTDLAIFWSARYSYTFIASPLMYRLTRAYWFTLVPLNVLLTLLIVGRIVLMRRGISSGQLDSSRLTTVSGGIITCLVESSVLYTVSTLVGLAFNYLVFQGQAIPRQANFVRMPLGITPFNPYLTQIECVASELIILRVALTRAWSLSTSRTTRESISLQWVGGDETRPHMPGDDLASSSQPPRRVHLPGIARATADDEEHGTSGRDNKSGLNSGDKSEAVHL